MLIDLLGAMLHSIRIQHMWKDAGDESDDVIHVYVWQPFFLERGIDLFSWRGPL